MNNQYTSSNSFQVKVLDEFHNVMFIATINYNKVTAFQNVVRPFITNSVMVEPGKGNAGKDLEYLQTTDGICIDYQVFVSTMNDGY